MLRHPVLPRFNLLPANHPTRMECMLDAPMPSRTSHFRAGGRRHEQVWPGLRVC